MALVETGLPGASRVALRLLLLLLPSLLPSLLLALLAALAVKACEKVTSPTWVGDVSYGSAPAGLLRLLKLRRTFATTLAPEVSTTSDASASGAGAGPLAKQ